MKNTDTVSGLREKVICAAVQGLCANPAQENTAGDLAHYAVSVAECVLDSDKVTEGTRKITLTNNMKIVLLFLYVFDEYPLTEWGHNAHHALLGLGLVAPNGVTQLGEKIIQSWHETEVEV